ncbi:hypothetical protein PI87_19370 [Ralstonia sp. A12]|uniref:hypothetical protein n=1 Tax=Ralstonia sp. A12 TaxID=1217052 RepID=UPI0005759C11|nr:hypothetical protein [Ralstonia sp. A12]KHK52931.1 hypothetical protein PI87_19370 [Ralstonia sp. A12]
MSDAPDNPPGEIAIVGAVITLLIVFPALFLIGFGYADPYPLSGVQSARWWWLRYPLVIAGFMVCLIPQVIIASRIDDADVAKEFEKVTDGMNAVLFATAIVVVTFGGSTLMNLYNASYGEGSIVKARRLSTFVSPKSNRSIGRTEVEYEFLEGPLKGETLRFSWSGTSEYGTRADDGRLALISMKRSWMGMSLLGVYDQ